MSPPPRVPVRAEHREEIGVIGRPQRIIELHALPAGIGRQEELPQRLARHRRMLDARQVWRRGALPEPIARRLGIEVHHLHGPRLRLQLQSAFLADQRGRHSQVGAPCRLGVHKRYLPGPERPNARSKNQRQDDRNHS